MEPFPVIHGLAAPLMIADVDTDVITPMRRIVAGGRDDLVRYAFEPLRYLPDGSENPDFALNQPRYAGAQVLLAGPNFGCGSSRETAVTAIRGLGFRCVIAASFGEIFHANCFQNGVLPIVLPAATVESLAREAEEVQSGEAAFTVDLGALAVATPSGRSISFEVNAFRREALLEGLDDVQLIMRRLGLLDAFEQRDRRRRPWVYALEAAGTD